ncbi:MAG: chondroitinase-B domain-containing protein, partial [Bacteroidota bacterium]
NEIISNKSAGNVYEHNTFRACRGSLVLRHGAGATVNGNFFLGEQKAKSGGVRITDSDHIITNNYFAGLSNGGDRWNNSITIVAGSETSGGSSNGYQEVDDILVVYNTFYQTDDPIYYNDRDNDVSSGTIAYNLAYSTRGALIAGDVNDTGSGMTYAGNIFGGSALGVDEATFTIADVDFEAVGEVSVPVAGSIVAGAAGDAYADVVSEDNFGLLRPETDLDVGAHEIEGATGEILFRPLTNDDVGNGVGASFLTADGHSGVAQSMSVGSLDRFGGEGGSQELDVFSNVAWTATTDADWITLTGGMGTNNGSITVTVGTYDGDDIRTGTITISGEGISRTVGVSQGVALSPANCPSGTNVAVEGSIASFTSQQNDDNAAANLIDADAGNRWSAEGFPQSAVIDLGATFLVNEVNLRPHQERDYRFTVEGSDQPAEDFVLLVDATDNTAGGSVINRTFEATPYRYWRLTVTGAATYEGPWVSISEFEVNCSGNFVSTNNPAAAAAGIVLRPVPAGDLLFVDKLPATYDTYSVFDLRGRRLLTGELKVSDGIDLSRVNASGFLVLRLVGPGQPPLVHKFVRRR